MRCRRAGELMMARMDGWLHEDGVQQLEDHLAVCQTCQAEWKKLSALDQFLRSVPMAPVPPALTVKINARIRRRETARRAVAGGVSLALGAAALALLMMLPLGLRVVENIGIVPALLMGGMETVTQLTSLIGAISRMLIMLLDRFAVPISLIGAGSFIVALALNWLWIVTLRRLRTAHG